MYVFLSLGFGIRPFISSQSIDIHVSAKQLGILKCFNCTKKLSRTTSHFQISREGRQVLERRSIVKGQLVVTMAICTAWD